MLTPFCGFSTTWTSTASGAKIVLCVTTARSGLCTFCGSACRLPIGRLGCQDCGALGVKLYGPIVAPVSFQRISAGDMDCALVLAVARPRRAEVARGAGLDLVEGTPVGEGERQSAWL
mmetsp:Transcript_65006/g.180789  ORF Transcript_65006/g.180789 Transcript_65006/m.180789 type:complete len:118 (-) Transcript_65006:94-447(-)